MANLRNGGPYIWATALPRLLTGESSCEWAAWFKGQHKSGSWTRQRSDFDQTQWLVNHTALLNQERQRLEEEGYTILTEGQNAFALKGRCATLGGRPDLVAERDGEVLVIDAKTGKPGPSHVIQILIYQYALPKALERYRGLTLTGQVAYPDHQVEVPAVDETFVRELGSLIQRLASDTPARQVPSLGECRFCDITAADCAARVEEEVVGEGETDDF